MLVGRGTGTDVVQWREGEGEATGLDQEEAGPLRELQSC